ncbi:hypothetical protein [Methylobacterium sp.]|uniref:hypothetical protein n=1 Tax=Methylobacterium sp. TaxID=409 RepID=UPI003B00F6E6
MTAPASRRGFLRGLTTLPLIGGSVALIGAPSAVAASITPGMLATYSAWLDIERRALHYASCVHRDANFIPYINPGANYHWGEAAFDRHRWGIEAQMRAPIVLAAVGCPLTSAEAEQQWQDVFRFDRHGGRP